MNASSKEHFTVNIYQMDIERVRYSLNRYLRTRMIKIEKELEFIQQNHNIYERLSDDEKVFLNKLEAQNNSFFNDTVSARLHEAARTYYDKADDRIQNAQPNIQVINRNVGWRGDLNSLSQEFVFCRATAVIEIKLPSEEDLEVQPGDINILQYSLIQQYVLDGRMHLL